MLSADEVWGLMLDSFVVERSWTWPWTITLRGCYQTEEFLVNVDLCSSQSSYRPDDACLENPPQRSCCAVFTLGAPLQNEYLYLKPRRKHEQ